MNLDIASEYLVTASELIEMKSRYLLPKPPKEEEDSEYLEDPETELKRRLQGRSEKVVMIENCGMENEAVYQGAECIPEEAGYYTLLIMKEEKE